MADSKATPVRVGSLFSGYGGLDMGVGRVWDTETVWVSDIDPGSCKVLNFRYPYAQNLGDITAIDWSTVPPVDVLTAGFPCQDVSLAGLRRGMRDGTRSGLWASVAEAVDVLRPSLVIVENVRGLLSAEADSHLESCPWCVGDRSAPVLRALGAVLGDLANLGYDCRWVSVRASDVGAPHRRERVFLTATNADKQPRHERWKPRSGETQGGRAFGESPGRGGALLLPTPVAQPSGNTPEEHLRKKPGRKVITDLAILAGNAFLPTPVVSQRSINSDHGRMTQTLVGLAQRLLPTPRATDAGNSMTAPSALAHVEAGFGTLPEVLGAAHPSGFDMYRPALDRWATVVGRPAPSPVEERPGRVPRLDPRFEEWMMGLPEGWVCDVLGVSRAQALLLLGNGVVPQQAEAAVRFLAGFVGVGCDA